MLAILALLAACGDEQPTTPPDSDALTNTEVQALVETALGQGFLALDVTGQTFDLTIPCGMGGAVQTAGEVTGSPEAERFTAAVTLTHQDCQTSHAETGLVFTITGAPSIMVALDVVTTAGDNPTLAMRGSVEGAVRWSEGDRDGTCRIDAQVEAGFGFEGVTLTVTGQACGSQLSSSV